MVLALNFGIDLYLRYNYELQEKIKIKEEKNYEDLVKIEREFSQVGASLFLLALLSNQLPNFEFNFSNHIHWVYKREHLLNLVFCSCNSFLSSDNVHLQIKSTFLIDHSSILFPPQSISLDYEEDVEESSSLQFIQV